MSEPKDRVILIPVDGSKHSERAFEWYLQNLKHKNDKIGIVNIVEPPTLPATFMMMGPVVIPEEWNAEVQDSLDKAKLVTEKFEAKCKDMNLPFSVITECANSFGGPGETICGIAKEKNASTIIMGSRGLNVFRRALLGSVSSYVVSHAGVPVIITPPE
eukprot:gene7335-8155_t